MKAAKVIGPCCSIRSAMITLSGVVSIMIEWLLSGSESDGILIKKPYLNNAPCDVKSSFIRSSKGTSSGPVCLDLFGDHHYIYPLAGTEGQAASSVSVSSSSFRVT